MIRDVNELKVWCTNHKEGCEWMGELGDVKSHLDSDKGCGYVEVTCTNEGCEESVSRRDLQTHMQEMCHYRPYECEHCGHKDTYKAVTDYHYSECPKYPLACPNMCGVTGITRKAMPDHHSSCPLAPLDCPLQGCEERVSRKDLQTHLQENCYYRPFECEHCGHKDTYRAITGETLNTGFKDHYSECPEYLLDCPNQCGATGIRRTAMPDHHTSCPLEPLDCLFKDAGCTEKIAHKDMEDHMTGNQQKHILQGYQSLQQMKEELDNTKKELQETKQELQATKQEFSNELQIITVGLRKIGDTLTFRVADFLQMRREKKVWYSHPFSIANKVRVRLAVYPSGIGRGQESHVSVSLVLMEVVRKEEDTRRRLPLEEIKKNAEHKTLQYNVSITAIRQQSPAVHTILALCTSRQSDISKLMLSPCSARFPFPSPGEMLRSDELFVKTEDLNSLLFNDSMILEMKLQEHQHH